MAACSISPENFYFLVLQEDPSEAIQFLQSIPLSSRLPFVSHTEPLGDTSLHAAARAGHFQLVQLLLDSGSDKDAWTYAQCSPLFFAARDDHPRVVEILLAAGADMNTARNDGSTPIFVASRFGRHRVVQLLLSAGADMNAAMYDGSTPIFAASQNGNHSVVESLLAAGAAFNIQKRDGVSPLFLASNNRHSKVVEMLLNWGADPNILDIHGTSVLDSTADPSCTDLLKKHGALSSSELAVRRLSNDTSLEFLPIDCSKLTPSDASSLTSLLASNQTITSLSLYNYRISSPDNTLLQFDRLFAQNTLPCSLRIKYCQFSSENFASIIDGIILNEKITSFDLESCRIKNRCTHLSRLLQQSSSLVSLTLQSMNLTTADAEALGNALQYNTTLTFLDLTRNKWIKVSQFSFFNERAWHISKNMSLYQLLIPILKDFDETSSLKSSSHPIEN
jgi:ankyrin repeat protein